MIEDSGSKPAVEAGEGPLLPATRRLHQASDVGAGRQGVGARHGLWTMQGQAVTLHLSAGPGVPGHLPSPLGWVFQ